MPLLRLRKRVLGQNLSPSFGTVIKINASTIVVTGISPSIGDIVRIVSEHKDSLGMVTEVHETNFFITPFGFVEGFKIRDRVYIDNNGMNIPVGRNLLGRVVNPFMVPIDGKGEIESYIQYPIIKEPISALKRGLITEQFDVGVKTINGLLTVGKGQKMGIFAGSGVGKSTLMGMIVKGSQSPIKVVALIGERGREVPEFIEKNLGGDLSNTVIITATSDDSPLMRKYGAFAAMSVAEYFKDQGEDVLFFMDSVTRFAMAQREIGLALGEPPTSKGYPPSALTILPQLMERAGKEEGKGSITAFFTVLVDGDDMSDPIADQSRSILDGHIILSRELTDYGIYPPINILNSASRVMGDVVTNEHLVAAQQFKKFYALLKENEMILRIGAYQGGDNELNQAIEKKEKMDEFLKQLQSHTIPLEESLRMLLEVVKLS